MKVTFVYINYLNTECWKCIEILYYDLCIYVCMYVAHTSSNFTSYT